MLRRTPLYIVCSPRPGVGKTLIARLLIDFFLAESRPVAGFDLAQSERSLVDYLPSHAVVARIDDIQGQMALFDRLIVDDKTAKVIDLGPPAFEPFFSILAKIDFVTEARRRSVEPVTLFAADPDRASVQAYGLLKNRLPGMTLIPVYNERFPHGSRADFPLTSAASLPMHIPNLMPLLHRYVDTPPFSFASFRGTPDLPSELYVELQRWLRRVFVEFREMELRLLLDDLRSALGASLKV